MAWRCTRLLAFVFVAGVACACGSRTGLLVPLPASDAGEPGIGDDATTTLDAPSVATDSGADMGEGEDDAALPPIDASPPPVINECPDAGATLIYVIAQDGTLMSFYPPTSSFTVIGPITCPLAFPPLSPNPTPFSMAVDRAGIAYTVFNDGELFRVSTAPTAPCESTPFISGQQGFSSTFGMGFSSDGADAGETLFVAGGAPGSQLASIDVKTYALRLVGDFVPTVTGAELTGTGAGDLFAFYSLAVGQGSAIGQVDKATGRIVAQSDLPSVEQGNGWAFAFWGGDFYTFTGPTQLLPPTSVVTRFRPADRSIVQVAQSDRLIVGAGVSTCAPER